MSPTEIVTAFVDAWNRMDWDAVVALLHDEVFYHNIPMEPIVGRSAARAAILGMKPERVDWQIIHIAANGNTVLTERVDRFDLPGGRHLEIPVMGTFEIEDGSIRAWRDYFDLATFNRQMG